MSTHEKVVKGIPLCKTCPKFKTQKCPFKDVVTEDSWACYRHPQHFAFEKVYEDECSPESLG